MPDKVLAGSFALLIQMAARTLSSGNVGEVKVVVRSQNIGGSGVS